MYIQTSREKGDKKENKFGGCLIGLLYKILIPVNKMKKVAMVLEENKDELLYNRLTKCHKRHCKVNSTFPFIRDG